MDYFFLNDVFPTDPPPSSLDQETTLTKEQSMPEIEVQKSTSSLGDPPVPNTGDATVPSSPIDPIRACFRTTFTTVNLLRVLQKMTKNKSFRVLRLVHFKSTVSPFKT